MQVVGEESVGWVWYLRVAVRIDEADTADSAAPEGTEENIEEVDQAAALVVTVWARVTVDCLE